MDEKNDSLEGTNEVRNETNPVPDGPEPIPEDSGSIKGRGWRSKRPRKDPDEPKQGWPLGAMIIVIVPSFFWMITDVPIESSGVPLPLAVVGHGLPILGMLLLGNHIRKIKNHTRRDKRRLWLFILGCYLMGAGLLFISSGGQTVIAETDPSTSLDEWEIGMGMQVLWMALPLFFTGLVIFLVLLSGKLPQERPVQYSGIMLGIILFTILMVPYVNQSFESYDGVDVRGWPEFDPIPPPSDEIRVIPLTSYLHGNYVEEEDSIWHDDFDDSALLLQLAMGILVMIFASLWSLFRPETYHSTFGFKELADD